MRSRLGLEFDLSGLVLGHRSNVEEWRSGCGQRQGMDSVRHPVRDAIIHKPMSCHWPKILEPTRGDQDPKVPCAVFGAFMSGMRGAVIMHLKNCGIGEASAQACANFVKGWTHQQP